MSLESKWAKAKKSYDDSFKEVSKARAQLQKEYDKLYKDAEKDAKKMKLKGKLDTYVNASVLPNEALGLKQHITLLKAKKVQISQAPTLKERKRTGAEPAFKDVDKVFMVGEKLISADVQDPEKWKKWRDMAVNALKGCAKAEKKFNDWLGRPSPGAEEDFATDFANIHRKMREIGTPMLKHAQRIIAG